MGWLWAVVQGILTMLNILGIWEQDKKDQALRDGREAESKLLSEFADSLQEDLGEKYVPESSHGEAPPGGPGLPD